MHETRADRMRIEQVVWNILSNAIKFTPPGGRISVTLEQMDEVAKIIVTDTGQGIPPEFLQHIFEAFRQADSSTTRRQGGLGLGLAIARQLIAMHGGDIAAESRGPNQGTTMTVTLPLVRVNHDAPLEQAQEASAVYQHDVLKGLRIAVVDDDLNTLTLLSIALREQGAEVNAVSSGREAMRLLAKWHPHVLLSDISMPEEDGYSLMRRVRALPEEQGGRIVALALTAMAGAEDRARAMEAGFDGHISKPVDLSTLVETVARLTRRDEAAQSA